MLDDYAFNLRLFFSVDLIGSTAFKARERRNNVSDWARRFREFFEGFPDHFKSAYEHLPKLIKPPSNRPRFWKFNGDEILFHVVLTRHEEAAAHVWALIEAARSFDSEWSGGSGKSPMPLKLTAWHAGFPVTNAVVRIPGTDDNDKAKYDFIGPNIDIGFRLTRHADRRWVPLSAGLALMLIDWLNRQSQSPVLRMSYRGRQSLKGVIDDAPHPVFFVDRFKDETPEDKVLPLPEFKPGEAAIFIRQFYEDDHGLQLPFIEGDPDPSFGNIPDKIKKRLDQIREGIEAEETSRNYAAEGQEPTARSPRRPSNPMVQMARRPRKGNKKARRSK